jgi:alpha-L-rhamnosidase
MWERWNGDQKRDDPTMNSYNHYAYGAVGDWIYRYAAGVDATPADAGFHTVRLHPNFDSRLGNLDFIYDSAYGPIHSQWSVAGKKATWKITIPPNATGRLELTADEAKAYQLDGMPIWKNGNVKPIGSGSGLFELAAGSYEFEVALR